MVVSFAAALTVGGRSNSLGRAGEVVDAVLDDRGRLPELYRCLFEDNPWVRMRAADSLEKVCRVHPDWLVPYVDHLLHDLGDDEQASVQWHLAQIFAQTDLTEVQRDRVAEWLEQRLATTDVDWIVAVNAMQTLAGLVASGDYPSVAANALFDRQRRHRSAAVVRHAERLKTPTLRIDPRTGFPVVDLGRRVTSAEVADLIDED